MSTTLGIFFCIGIFILVIVYNIVIQYKIKEEQKIKQEISRYRNIISVTEELIGFSQHFPFSDNLYTCLYTKILDALIAMRLIDLKNKNLITHIKSMKVQIYSLKEKNNNNTNFRTPTNDKQAIMLLKITKRLKDTIRIENRKGRFNIDSFLEEEKRLTHIQLRINIENAIQRSTEHIIKNEHGTAIQLINKSLSLLEDKDDDYSIAAKIKLESIQDSLKDKRKTKNEEEIKIKNEKERDEMDQLFGKKVKW